MLCTLASSAVAAAGSPSGLLTHSQSCVQVVVVVVLILASTTVTRVVCWKEEVSVEGVAAATRPEILALQKSL